jgi:hypothetical protein
MQDRVPQSAQPWNSGLESISQEKAFALALFAALRDRGWSATRLFTRMQNRGLSIQMKQLTALKENRLHLKTLVEILLFLPQAIFESFLVHLILNFGMMKIVLDRVKLVGDCPLQAWTPSEFDEKEFDEKKVLDTSLLRLWIYHWFGESIERCVEFDSKKRKLVIKGKEYLIPERFYYPPIIEPDVSMRTAVMPSAEMPVALNF